MFVRTAVAALIAAFLTGAPLAYPALAQSLAQKEQPGGGAAPPSPGDLLKQLADARKNKKANETAIGEVEQEKVNAEKKKKIYAPEERKHRGVVVKNMRPYLAKERKYDTDLKRYNVAKTRVEARCAPGGKVPPGVHAKCRQDKAGNDRWKAGLDKRRNTLNQKNKQIRDYVKKYLVPVVAARKQAEADLKKINERLAKLRKNVAGWNRYIAELKKRLYVSCTRATTCEARKLCRSYSWTGGRPDLPPLPPGKDRPTFQKGC